MVFEMTLYLNQIADLAVIGAVIWFTIMFFRLQWLLKTNSRLQKLVLAKFDEYPRSVLKDLQSKARKNEKHAVIYRGEDGIVRTAKEMVTGELDK